MASNFATHAEDVTLLRETALWGEPPAHLRRLFERLLPLAYVNLGNRCNLACPYCSVDTHRLLAPEAAAVEDDLARLAGAGLRKVTLLGGEPTCRADLPRLLGRARELGFVEINLTTNGLRLADAAYLDEVLGAGLTSVQLSLHASDPRLIGQLADAPGAGPRVLTALENLLGRPEAWLFFATLLATPTLAHLPTVVQAAAGWSARAGRELPVILTGMLPQARALDHHAEVMPTPAAAAGARAALEQAARLGVAAVHRNLVPCLLPGWEAWSADGLTVNARLRPDTGEVLPGQRDVAYHQRRACAGCRWQSSCPGVHAGTVALFGWGDHRPVPDAAVPASRAPRPRPARRAVVVGGSGLLGRQVVARLVEDGWHVTSLARREVPAWMGAPPASALTGDRADPAVVRTLLAASPELWIDLALFGPAEADALVRAWPKEAPPRLVVAGSVAEYGALHRLARPLPEDAPLAADDAYGRGKAAAWETLREAATAGSVDVTWAVLPQLWGPGDHHYRDGAIVHAILAGRPVVLRGSGDAPLADGFAGTVAEALLHVAGRPELTGRRVHVAGPGVLSPLQWIGHAAGVLRRDATVLLAPPEGLARVLRRAGAVLPRPLPDRDARLALNALEASGFQPSVDPADGVRVTTLAHAARPAPSAGPGALSLAVMDALAALPGARTVRLS